MKNTATKLQNAVVFLSYFYSKRFRGHLTWTRCR